MARVKHLYDNTPVLKLVPESTNADTTTADITMEVARVKGLTIKIQCDWKGDSEEAALEAAMEIGKLVASQILTSEEGGKELRKLFVARKTPEDCWEAVNETFEKT